MLVDPIAPPKNYWANTSGNDLILRLLKKADQTTKDEVEELMNGGRIKQRMIQELTCPIVVMRQFTTKSAYHIEKMEKYGRIDVLHDNILEGQLQSALKMPTSLIIRRFLEITWFSFL